MGPQHAELDLPTTMSGAEFLPQTTVIPQVDLVITHGGNNTTTEALHFGKPMMLLPLFWDQYDNAQRVRRARLRRPAARPTRSPTASCTARSTGCWPTTELRARLAAIGADIRARDGLRRGAEVIEPVGQAHREQVAGRP